MRFHPPAIFAPREYTRPRAEIEFRNSSQALLAFIHLYERTVSEAGTIADYNLFPAAMAA